ncbi:shikimate kinase 3, chloroplastic isoform X1 [Ricinus communis]|uniref:shikimate kinase 3, chloroplastic isoform X1 n=1 Tax=Ricinus communis TaxID=3988 RepID=UPI00201A3513|nr:shikimate kinase 3, chloroplastic isoform X1 [Ricinus communis]XP_048226826.1 shikimate kinase 3, chloroplastic isoform X1 [Ricinus communis]
MSTSSHALNFSMRTGHERIEVKQNSVIGFSKRCKRKCIANCGALQRKREYVFVQQRRFYVGISNACRDPLAPSLLSGNICGSFDGYWLLKTKGKKVASGLKGCCVFLVGMMGSGKTTVGKILSEALGYTFVDSDEYVEQTAGGNSVSHIFQQYGEDYFRDIESEALQKLSIIPRQVVATGGGSVVRPINWKYMRQGITVFLDVPLDALARRIAAVGTDSRPLLHLDSGDPYTKAFMGLFTLSKKRVEAYSDADVIVSLLDLADDLGFEDVSDVGPAAIALEVLIQIQKYLQDNNEKSMQTFL